MGLKGLILITLMFSGLGGKSFALDSQNLCEDLAKYTCSNGSHFDGTGTVQRLSREETSNDAILRKHYDFIQKKFESSLKNPRLKGFRKLCISTLRFQNSEQCQTKSENLVGACDEQITKRLWPFLMTALGGAETPISVEQRLQGVKIAQHEGFQKIIKNIRKEISLRETDPRKLALLKEKVFPQLKSALIRKLEELPIADSRRAAMIGKIRKTQLDKETLCDAGSTPILFRAIARYDADKNTVRVCDGSLSENFSEFKLVRSVGHEIAHSIDPCNIGNPVDPKALIYSTNLDRTVMESEYPLKELISCLRSEKSAAAKSRPASSPVSSSEYQPIEYIYDFCDNDQINESLADWFGNELLTDYIAENHQGLSMEQWREGFSNVFRTNCNDPESADDIHPSNEVRINRLLLVNPQVRKKMGCLQPSKYTYCNPSEEKLKTKKSLIDEGVH